MTTDLQDRHSGAAVLPLKVAAVGVVLGMFNLVFLLGLCLAALVVAWVVNTIVNMLSGENRNDTGSLRPEVMARLFAVKEFGIVAWVLNYSSTRGWPVKILYVMGMLGIVAFLLRACRDTTS